MRTTSSPRIVISSPQPASHSGQVRNAVRVSAVTDVMLPDVRQLLPEAVDDVDPLDCYGRDARPSPGDRPWVLLGMIASADGSTAVDGRSGKLGGAADKAVFAAVRH